MRFTSILVAGFLALTASAQSATGTTTAAATSASVDPAQASALACLNACPNDANIANCQAHCIAVPSPDSGAANRTNQCVAACPVGTGTAADNQAYTNCVNGCVGQYFYTQSVGTPTGTGKADSGSSVTSGASASVTNIVSVVTSGSSTFTTTIHSTAKASGTGSASASSSSSGNAADAVFRPGTSAVGLLGFLAALLAL